MRVNVVYGILYTQGANALVNQWDLDEDPRYAGAPGVVPPFWVLTRIFAVNTPGAGPLPPTEREPLT